uniref:Uncharacterized protein n=1 Tax=Romanomermis culicivorax TaxID=13658 RepID=A0A915HH25_ROMCU
MSICKSPKTVDVCVDYVCQNNVFDNKDDHDDDDEDEEYSSESQESIKNKACTPADITAIKNQLLRCNKDDIVKCIPELQQPKTESNVAAGEENNHRLFRN